MTQYSSDDDALAVIPVPVEFFCLTNHLVFVKFVFIPFYSTLSFLFFKRIRNGWSELIFIVIILTSVENQSKRLGISLNFVLFLHIPKRALSGNREEGDLKSCQENSREMCLPSSQLCCGFGSAGQRDAHRQRREAKQRRLLNRCHATASAGETAQCKKPHSEQQRLNCLQITFPPNPSKSGVR